jgi:chromatin remodeling complex protein RSC6
MPRKGNPAFMKELKCSEELREFLKGEKKISRPQLMKEFWNYAKKHKLQIEDNKRCVKVVDSKLEPLFSSKLIAKKRELKVGKKTVKIPAGCVFMTEIGGALGKHLS